MRPFFVALIAICVALAAAPSAFAQRAPDAASWRALDPESTLYIDTNKGRIVVEMFPEVAPQHVERIKTLARAHFYDGLTFFRVIDGFMAQTGDPLNSGEGASQLPDLQGEFLFRRGADMPFVEASLRGGSRQGFYKTLPIETQPDNQMRVTRDQRVSAWGLHCAGAAAMARAEDPNSANSQFFLTRAPYPSLDKRYTIWGRVVFGQATVNAIQVGEPPEAPDRMTSVRVAADLPDTERAPLYVMRTDGRDFRELINETRNERRADFSVCDVEIPVRVPQDRRERRWWSIIPFIP